MHSCATSKNRESRPQHLGFVCTRFCKCSAALVTLIKPETENLSRQSKPRTHRCHKSRLSDSIPCFYSGVHVNLDPKKIASVLHLQPKSPFGKTSVWELEMSKYFVTFHLCQRVGTRRNDKQKDKPDQTSGQTMAIIIIYMKVSVQCE